MTPLSAPAVTVLITPKAIAEAKDAADAYVRRTTPASPGPDYLEILGQFRLRPETIARFALERERIEPRLRQIANESGAPAAAACIALISLGEHSLSARLEELLSSETSPALGKALDQIALSSELIRGTPLFDRIGPAIRQLAEDREHPDRFAAMHALFELGIVPKAEDIVDALVLKTAGVRFVEPWTSSALATIARSQGPQAVSAARALLRRPFVDSFNVLRAAKSHDKRTIADLTELLDPSVRKDHQGAALEALAMLGADVLPQLVKALEDPDLCSRAATGLGIACEGTGDEAVVQALTLSVASASYADPHVTAIARIGGPLALRTLAGLHQRAGVSATLFAVWRAMGITAADAIRRFVEAGIVPQMPSAEDLDREIATDWVEPKDVRLVWRFLRQSGHFVETLGADRDDQPAPRHPMLLETFAAISHGELVLEHASESTSEPHGPLERSSVVCFVCRSRVYQVTARWFNTNFDLTATLTVLHEALADQGSSRRFVPLHAGDTAEYLFGDPDAIGSACDALFIPYGDRRLGGRLWRDKVNAFFRDAAGLP
jgi:hypothetical protein